MPISVSASAWPLTMAARWKTDPVPGAMISRISFASDPALVAELVEQVVEEGIIDLADIRLVAAGIAGDLDVADARHQALGALGEIALHDLAVIEVELQPRIVAGDAVEDADALRRRVEEIAGDVARVDRLDKDCDAVFFGEIGGRS